MLKPKENHQGILKIYSFCWKVQQKASSAGEGAAGVMYLSMRIYPKSCHIFPLKVSDFVVQERAQLEYRSSFKATR